MRTLEDVATRFAGVSDGVRLLLTAGVSAGPHNVAVAFTNDYYDGIEDRNLFVDKVTIQMLNTKQSTSP